MVTECEQPTRKTRRGNGKSDPIDAHLAVLAALQLDTAKLAIPRGDGDREALRILLCARAELDAIVSDLAPGLTSRPGIGPVTAAQAIVSFSHPGRCRHDAASARLAGTSPIEASSGQTTRHRLNRGGDRAQQAIHIIATTRMRTDPATRASITRRRAQGKSDREIRRCLNRYIVRQLYRALAAAMTPA
jgi:transposase